MRITRTVGVVALFVAVLAAGIAGLVAWHFVPSSMFKAQARLHVAAVPPKVLFSTVDTTWGDDYRRFQLTQQNLLKSRFVLSSALRDPKVRSCETLRPLVDPYEWLSDKLKVEFVAGSEVMEISLSGNNPVDLANIVNAVQRAYMDEVVNVDAKRRTARHEQLKKLRESYATLLKSKRETMLRRLAEAKGSSERIAGMEKDAGQRLYQELQSQRTKQRMERAEIETLLERRKSAGGAAADAARKEIPQLEDRLAVLTAGQKVVDEELERLAEEMHSTTIHVLELKGLQDEIAQIEETYRKIAAEVEALNVELEAPRRIRMLDEATVPNH
jgi:uncharacterized protein involved in exopolysaccharide biosynthesis